MSPIAMSSDNPNATTIEPASTIPLSTDFRANDADVIICAASTLNFHAHKLILSLASPIFKDMFTVPQPSSDPPDTLPHVDVQDSPKTWEIILRTIYPDQPTPTIDTLDNLESLLFAAHAYEMRPVIETHKKALEYRAFVEKDPLCLYAIACRCGLEDQATYVARNAELATVTKNSDSSDPKGLTLGAYRRLVSFLVERDSQWDKIIRGTIVPGCDSRVCSQTTPPQPLYDTIKKRLLRPHVHTEEAYLKALEDRSRYGKSGCNYHNMCPFESTKIKEFICTVVKGREKACDRLQPDKWY